jgi:hypothetical protein
MAATGAAKRIEEKYGEPLETLLPKMLARFETVYNVAVEFGVYPGTVTYWIKKHRIHFDAVTGNWVKESEEESQAAISAA